MPTNHEAVAALPAGLIEAVKQLIRDMAVRRMAYVVSAASEVPDLVAVDPASGAAILVITCLGRAFLYDPTDTTTAHDGTTCLVSYEGRRYKLAVGTDVVVYSVINNTTSTPPGSPSISDAYLIAAGATGAWAGHSNQITVYTSRGWEFITPAIGRFIYVNATDSYYHRNSGGTLVAGFGSQSLAADSVPLSALINKPVRHFIENQTTNAPPGAAAVGVAYIIGPSPTGSWAGNAGKLAICEVVNTFTIYTQRTGELAYDKALGKEVKWSGTAWVSGSDALVLIQSQLASSSATIDFTSGLDDTYDDYFITVSNAKLSANNVTISIQVGTGVGPTYQSAGYGYANFSDFTSSGGSNQERNNSATSMFLVRASSGGNGAGRSFCSRIDFSNPDSADYCSFAWTSHFTPSVATVSAEFCRGVGQWNTVGPITAIRFVTTSGSFLSGRFSLYGMRKL